MKEVMKSTSRFFDLKHWHYPWKLRLNDPLHPLYRGIFIIPLGCFGILHFVYPHFFLFMVPQFAGQPQFWVTFSGVALLLASVSIFSGVMGKLANRLLLLFVLTFIFSVDIPMIINLSDDRRYYFMMSILKDFSLLGGSISLYLLQKKRFNA